MNWATDLRQIEGKKWDKGHQEVTADSLVLVSDVWTLPWCVGVGL